MAVNDWQKPHLHGAIITKTLFDKVQEVLKQKSRKIFSHEQKYQAIPFTFRGLIRCGTCGCAITPEQKCKPNGKRYTYLKYRSIKKFEVSNIGRVQITNGNNEIQVIGQKTYDKTNLALVDYKAFEYGKVYLLVAKVWLKDTRPEGSKRWAVHHIDNNGRNNKPENLIWLSPEDHGKVNHKK